LDFDVLPLEWVEHDLRRASAGKQIDDRRTTHHNTLNPTGERRPQTRFADAIDDVRN
jgi:hypothetical protein